MRYIPEQNIILILHLVTAITTTTVNSILAILYTINSLYDSNEI